jgi:hypothetical protein
MSHTEYILAQHPYIAIFTSLFGFLTPFITSMLPILQFIVLILSIWLTIMTIDAKFKEAKHRKRRNKHD